MKNYLLFAGYECYPEGGWNDLVDCFYTLNAAVEKAKCLTEPSEFGCFDWWHIVEVETWSKVASSAEVLA